MEIRNAVIMAVSLGRKDQAGFTANLYLDYGGVEQMFGGITLDKYEEPERDKGDQPRGARVGTEYGMNFIIKILETVGVKTWEDLVGKSIRVKCSQSRVHAIGHFLKDIWFAPNPKGERK